MCYEPAMTRRFLLAAVLAFPVPALAQESLVAGLEAAAKANPRDAAAQAALGRAQRRAGRFDEATKTLRAVSNRDLAAAYELAQVYFDTEDHHAAENACRKVKQLAKGAAVGSICEGRAWLAWRRESRAAAAFEKALATDPRSGEALVGLGDGRRMLSDVQAAEGFYNRALEVNPNDVDAHLGLVELYLSTTGRAQDARAHIRAAIRADPDSSRARLLCARMVGHGRWAADAVQKALAIRPRWAEARQMLGTFLLEDGKVDEAAAEFQQAIRLQDNLGVAHEGLGLCHLAGGRLPEAEAELTRAMAIIPNLPKAKAGIAEVQARTNRVDEAIETFRAAADLDPRNPAPLLRAAQILREQHRDTVARGFIERALAIDPNLAAAQAMLGDIFWDLQDWQHSREAYEAAVRGQLDTASRARANERLVQLRQL
jgi:tetratricopeptide (TPR) repeat protein